MGGFSLSPMDINVRKEQFRKHVIEVGVLTYTKRMLDEFINYWSECDRAKKPKMKWEKQPTWETPRRLSTWAQRTREYRVYLTEGEVSIAAKRRAFGVSLEKYMAQYSREILNAFYGYWSQPENVKNPEYLRWEKEEFWDLGHRLKQWSEKPFNQPRTAPTQNAMR